MSLVSLVASQSMPNEALIEEPNVGSHTASLTLEDLDGLERLSSSSEWRCSLKMPNWQIFSSMRLSL